MRNADFEILMHSGVIDIFGQMVILVGLKAKRGFDKVFHIFH